MFGWCLQRKLCGRLFGPAWALHHHRCWKFDHSSLGQSSASSSSRFARTSPEDLEAPYPTTLLWVAFATMAHCCDTGSKCCSMSCWDQGAFRCMWCPSSLILKLDCACSYWGQPTWSSCMLSSAFALEPLRPSCHSKRYSLFRCISSIALAAYIRAALAAQQVMVTSIFFGPWLQRSCLWKSALFYCDSRCWFLS